MANATLPRIAVKPPPLGMGSVKYFYYCSEVLMHERSL